MTLDSLQQSIRCEVEFMSGATEWSLEVYSSFGARCGQRSGIAVLKVVRLGLGQ